MFIIGIFGIEEKEKELRDFANVVCPDCGRLTRAVLTVHFTYFHVFFIPTLRWNRCYTVRLRGCSAVYEADEVYARQLEKGGDIDFSRLKKITGGFGGFENAYAVCAGCGRTFDAGFAFCPHCGAKK